MIISPHMEEEFCRIDLAYKLSNADVMAISRLYWCICVM